MTVPAACLIKKRRWRFDNYPKCPRLTHGAVNVFVSNSRCLEVKLLGGWLFWKGFFFFSFFLASQRKALCALLFRRLTLKIFVYSPLFNLMAWIWSKQARFKILLWKTSTEIWLNPTAECQMNHWYIGNVWTWWQWCDQNSSFLFVQFQDWKQWPLL